MKTLLLLLGACAIGLPAAVASTTSPGVERDVRQDDPIAEFLKTVKKVKDQTDPKLFAKIGEIGDEASFKALKKAVQYLDSPHKLRLAYAAMTGYPAGTELGDKAFKYLEKEAWKGKEDENKRAATQQFQKLGERGLEQLEKILSSHRDDACRVIAVQPLLPRLAERGDLKSLDAILEYAPTRNAQQKQKVAEALSGFEREVVEATLIETLKDEDRSRDWRLLILDRVGDWKGEAVTELLVDLTRDPLPDVRLRSIELLGERGDPEVTRTLYKGLDAKDGATQKASILALAKLRGFDPDWVDAVFRFAEDKDEPIRMGAAGALAVLRTQQAMEALHGLLFDTARPVRAEALQQVGNVHRKDSVPFLIRSLGQEKGRMKHDVASVLRLMTGLDHGLNPNRWEAWWRQEGEAFELPTYEAALKAEKERNQRREENNTATSFYGLQVLSDRVCFVVDVSGSMNDPAQGRGKPRTGSGGRAARGGTRLDVAKEQLKKTIEGLSDGVHFNMVFFATDVFAWEDRLVTLGKDTREEALEYTERQRAAGSTAVYDALALAFEDESIDTIFLLTDGAPSAGSIVDPQDIRETIARMNAVRHIRIHCISIGQRSGLLRNLAADSGGEYREAGMGED